MFVSYEQLTKCKEFQTKPAVRVAYTYYQLFIIDKKVLLHRSEPRRVTWGTEPSEGQFMWMADSIQLHGSCLALFHPSYKGKKMCVIFIYTKPQLTFPCLFHRGGTPTSSFTSETSVNKRTILVQRLKMDRFKAHLDVARKNTPASSEGKCDLEQKLKEGNIYADKREETNSSYGEDENVLRKLCQKTRMEEIRGSWEEIFLPILTNLM
jgi:hypothetical protein